MLVRMRTNITGTRDGQPWPAPGGVIDLPDHEAADLIVAGYAEEARHGQDETPVADDDATHTGDEGEAHTQALRAVLAGNTATVLAFASANLGDVPQLISLEAAGAARKGVLGGLGDLPAVTG